MTDYTLAYIKVGRNAGQVRGADGYLDRSWEWQLSDRLAGYCDEEYHGRWYSLVHREDGWYIQAHTGCVWDLATGWIDWQWLIEASLGHDILVWLIKRGAIPESANDLIDKELTLIARARGTAFGLRPRLWFIRKATNLVDQDTDGKGREIVYLYGN